MRIIEDIKLDFNDVLIQPKRSTLESRSEVDLLREFTFPHSHEILKCIPIVASNMDTVGTFEMHDVLSHNSLLTTIHKHYTKAEWQEFNPVTYKFVIPSIGASQFEFDELMKILAAHTHINKICIDVANGYHQNFLKAVERVRNSYPWMTIIAGNVVTPEMTEALILAGADVVKVGIGSGAACTTRLKTGVGYPQLSAIIECADAAHGLNGHVMSDGGCVTPGDIAKAFAAGADFVMLGSMLAGHAEAGEKNLITEVDIGVVPRKGKAVPRRVVGVRFRGMSSSAAMKDHHGEVDEYRTSEGRELTIPYKGKVEHTLRDILGGLRSACTYTGAKTLKELPKRATFIRVNNQLNDSLVR